MYLYGSEHALMDYHLNVEKQNNVSPFEKIEQDIKELEEMKKKLEEKIKELNEKPK